MRKARLEDALDNFYPKVCDSKLVSNIIVIDGYNYVLTVFFLCLMHNLFNFTHMWNKGDTQRLVSTKVRPNHFIQIKDT